jgi:hypothetical protein
MRLLAGRAARVALLRWGVGASLGDRSASSRYRTLGLTYPAGTDRVEHVRSELEPFGSGERGQGAVELAFELRRKMHVGHRTTAAAGEVVMVADERLRELEPCELADAGHAVDDAFGLEDCEVAVDAARALPRRTNDDLVDGERAARGRERLDQIPARPRVAAVAVGEARRHRIVQVGRHEGSIPGRWL